MSRRALRTPATVTGREEMTTVVNKRAVVFDIDICRPSSWGNPFRIGVHGTREQVIDKFRLWVLQQPALIELAQAHLKDRVLGCVCKPLPCHGDVWAEILD